MNVMNIDRANIQLMLIKKYMHLIILGEIYFALLAEFILMEVKHQKQYW